MFRPRTDDEFVERCLDPSERERLVEQQHSAQTVASFAVFCGFASILVILFVPVSASIAAAAMLPLVLGLHLHAVASQNIRLALLLERIAPRSARG